MKSAMVIRRNNLDCGCRERNTHNPRILTVWVSYRSQIGISRPVKRDIHIDDKQAQREQCGETCEELHGLPYERQR